MTTGEQGNADYTATLPRKRMGAAVLLSDEAGRMLLVEPTYKPYWEIPGGRSKRMSRRVMRRCGN